MMSATLTATNGHRGTQPWLRETVQAFFEGVPWSGMPTHQASSAGTANAASQGTAESPLTLTVGQFFEMMSWEGKPTIGAPIAPLEAPSPASDAPSDDLTLDDFSSLFG
jgi:hypothetical protein